MRISDWSSDVCSSDLPVLRRPPETEPPPGRPFRPATALVFALMLAAILFASAALQAWLGEAGDRKSVVQGKSVSVRVDLGGRRIINTQITTLSNIFVCEYSTLTL